MAAGMAGAGFCLVLAMIVLVVALGDSATRLPPAARTAPSRLSPGDTGPGRLGLLVAQFRGARSERGDKFRIARPGNWGISWQFRCTRGHPGDLTVRADNATSDGGRGDGYARRIGNGNGKTPSGQARNHGARNHGASKHGARKHGASKHGARKHEGKKAAGTIGHRSQPGAGDKRGRGHRNGRVAFSASGYHGHGTSWYTSDPGDHTLDVISGCSWVIKIVLPKR